MHILGILKHVHSHVTKKFPLRLPSWAEMFKRNITNKTCLFITLRAISQKKYYVVNQLQGTYMHNVHFVLNVLFSVYKTQMWFYSTPVSHNQLNHRLYGIRSSPHFVSPNFIFLLPLHPQQINNLFGLPINELRSFTPCVKSKLTN